MKTRSRGVMSAMGLVLLLAGLGNLEAGISDWFKSQEQKDREVAVEMINYRRQVTIEKYHLMAKAESTELLEYAWLDSAGKPTKDTKTATLLAVVYVIRWSSPGANDGYSKLFNIYDFGRPDVPVIAENLINTNGTTNAEAANTAVSLFQILSGR